MSSLVLARRSDKVRPDISIWSCSSRGRKRLPLSLTCLSAFTADRLLSLLAELSYTREEIAKHDRLKKNYEDPTFEVVSGVFRALSKKKIIGSGTFQR